MRCDCWCHEKAKLDALPVGAHCKNGHNKWITRCQCDEERDSGSSLPGMQWVPVEKKAL
jgi:hypothetical protein